MASFRRATYALAKSLTAAADAACDRHCKETRSWHYADSTADDEDGLRRWGRVSRSTGHCQCMSDMLSNHRLQLPVLLRHLLPHLEHLLSRPGCSAPAEFITVNSNSPRLSSASIKA